MPPLVAHHASHGLSPGGIKMKDTKDPSQLGTETTSANTCGPNLHSESGICDSWMWPNQLLLFACLLFLIQILTRGCAILEHPQLPEKRNGQQPASIWKLGLISFILNMPDVYALDIKQGYWGAASPKPTRLMVTMPGAQSADLHRWLDAYRTTSRLPQPIKMGRTQEGHYRTAPLKRYPPGLCRGLSHLCQKAATVIHQRGCRG